ncbi:hypothetical protein OsJ_16187 [Oryza sativa Japonica Group]|uniref:Uncharacterized protein n=1 Tax=Oryza sativa subsp. japonica TaxID=39947 RepID=B9FCJ8_ORYSJ|nr:hypothetical protein OsJ_16187 [Oryza sativa Japonica Group]
MAAAAVKSPEPPFAFRPARPPLPPLLDDEEDGEFEFSVPAAAAVLSAADELFSGGRLVPMLPPPPRRPPSSSSPPCSPPPCLEVPPSEPASPRAPRCGGHRWRDLLTLVSKRTSDGEAKDRVVGGSPRRREAHAQPLLSRASSSSSSASSCDSGIRNARRAAAEPAPPRLVSSCYLGISASLEAERHHRRPQRLLLAWGKTTAAQHVVVWHLDHTFEKLASAHLPLVAAAPLVDALRASPAKPLALFDLARRLPLRLHRRGALYFLHLSPRMFGLRAPLPLSLSLPRPPPSSSPLPLPPQRRPLAPAIRWGDGDGEGCTSGAI